MTPLPLPHTLTKQVAVAEDWYPTVNGLVEVKLYFYSNGMRRVCVWGGDDFGMELDTFDDLLAKQLFARVNHLVTQADLRSWGFVPA